MPGYISSYVHTEGRVGALVEIRFRESTSARTNQLQSLAHDLAMQVTAMNPLLVKPSQLNIDAWNEELERLGTSPKLAVLTPTERVSELQAARQNYERNLCLLKQPFIKNDSVTVEERIAQVAGELSEQIEVVRFSRFEVEGP